MDEWESLIETCKDPVDLNYFNKVIQTAGVVLKQDLAEFETDWILQTLLHKPVGLLTIAHTFYSDPLWSKALANAFKLLADVVDDLKHAVEPYFEDIVNICHLRFDSTVRKNALLTLTSVAHLSPLAARDVQAHAQRLQDVTTCRAPAAVLLGTICEHHPETVEDHLNLIWRIYLNLLDSKKNSATITSALLQGVLGLFKHFGSDLQTAELNGFYDKLVSDYLPADGQESFGVHKTLQQVCLKILASHANLFREKLSKDDRLRAYLWRHLQNSPITSVCGIKAVTSVYTVMCQVMDTAAMQKIASEEIAPKTLSQRTQVKYTAFRILTHIQTHYSFRVDIEGQIDVNSLEFELREENVSFDVAEAVAFCIESNLPNSENLLQSAIIYYQNLPQKRRKEIVVHGILNASPELRRAATNFLISESTIDEESMEGHLMLWRDLFDTNKGSDEVVMDKSKYVFEDFMTYAIFVVESFLEDGGDIIPEKLTTLLQLTTHILTFQLQENYTADFCARFLHLLLEIARISIDSTLLSAIRCAIKHLDQVSEVLREFYQAINIDRCISEAVLCESCLILIQAPDDLADVANVLMAIQIIFSRGDVEPAILSQALQKLESLISCQKVDVKNAYRIIQRLEKIHYRREITGKEGRILHRDITLFLGKYGVRKDEELVANINLVRLMDGLALSIPNTDDGVLYKLNLQRIINLALEHEEADTLQNLLIIICVNLTSKPEPNLQQILMVVCHALCRAHARGSRSAARAVQAAILECPPSAGGTLLQCICEEKSPGVRKMLSDGLEELLVADKGDELVSSVFEHAAVMMRSSHITKKRAGLNIAEPLLTALRSNNALFKEYLPELIKLITKTFEQDSNVTFDIASEIFMEKIELFDDGTIKNLIKDLMEILTSENQNGVAESNMAALNVKAFKNTTKMTIEFMKNVFNHKLWEKTLVCEISFEVLEKECLHFEKWLYFLAEMRLPLDLNTEFCRELLSYGNCMVFDKVSILQNCMEDDYLRIEVLLKYLEIYFDVLLELRYEETLKCLAEIINNLKPLHTKYLYRQIQSCLSVYTDKKVPDILQKAFESWCSKLPLNQITVSIEKQLFTTEHSLVIFALKKVIIFFDVTTLTDLAKFARKWATIILKLYSSDYITKYLKSKMSYLTDLLTVSVKFLTVTDVKKLLLEGSDLDGLPNDKIGVRFGSFFMHVFFDVLISKEYILLGPEMEKCTVLLNDVVKYSLKRKCSYEQYEIILDLVDKLWPTYASQTTFSQKQILLLDMTNFVNKLDSESLPMKWAVDVLTSDSSREEKARVLAVLPGGDDYSRAYHALAATLPARLSDMRGDADASFRAILDALAVTGDRTLFNIVISLSAVDSSEGWWDDAIESCMRSLATKADVALLSAVYTRVRDSRSLAACDRVLLPLLRYSASTSFETFLSTILKKLVTPFKFSKHQIIMYLVDCATTFKILTLAFEKLSRQSLESTDSLLYEEIKPEKTWFIVRSTCNLCVTLRDATTLPEGADDALKEDFRKFQCANYNCLTSAVCVKKPDEKIYDKTIIDVTVWNALVDDGKEYNLRIRTQWNQRTKRRPISISLESNSNLLTAGSSTQSRTVRSRVFLRTLSENPLMYDLLPDDSSKETNPPELHLAANELNNHECASTLTALLSHMSALPYNNWKEVLVRGLRDAKRNCRWLLAQAICNCKEDLKQHSAVIYPALLELLSTTAIEVNGKKVLNGLHIDILETLIHWSPTLDGPSEPLNRSLQLLLTTILEHRKHNALYNYLREFLNKFLDVFGTYVQQIGFDVVEGYLSDAEISKTLKVLGRLYKANIRVEPLLPTLLGKMESQGYQLSNLAELFGLALNACGYKTDHLNRFQRVLEKLRNNNMEEYIKVLYYAQNGCPECCNEFNFRMTIDQTQKLIGAEKSKCLQIISRFISHNPASEYVLFMFESIGIQELILSEHLDAFAVVKEGVTVLNDGLKRQLMNLVTVFCGHSVGKVRKAAFEIVLEAFEDLFKIPETSQVKRSKTSSSPIMTTIFCKEIYANTILTAIAQGCVDKDSSISTMVRERVGKIMSKNMEFRFTEAFLLTIYLPIMCNKKCDEVSVCVSAMLDLLLRELKASERFKLTRLRDEPLEIRATSGPSKLLTMSTTYQGTFSRHTTLTSKKYTSKIKDPNDTSPDIDVQVSIDSILDTFLKFAKNTPQASQTLCIELLKSIKNSHKFETSSEIAESLSNILVKHPNTLTPIVLAICELFVEDLSQIDGVINKIEKLKTVTKNSEGEFVVKNLYQNINSLVSKDYIFGVKSESIDIPMSEDLEFSIKDLTLVFNKLSNWDNLTVKERNDIKNNGLPPLWTHLEDFKSQLDVYADGSAGWFTKMVSAYKHEGKENIMRWLKEMDQWPRRHFDLSATTEAIEWLSKGVDNVQPVFEIHRSDCLAEWAARLMIRSAYQQHVLEEPDEAQEMLSRSHELSWCKLANERELGAAVLDCVKRNSSTIDGEIKLRESETLPWFVQQVAARRQVALRAADTSALETLLDSAKTHSPKFIKKSTADDVVAVEKLIILLRQDLNELSNEHLIESFKIIAECTKTGKIKNKVNLMLYYEIAINYYDNDDLWQGAFSDKEILPRMLHILDRIANLGVRDAGFLAVLLNRLDMCGQLEENYAKKLIDLVHLYLPTIDEFSLSNLKRNKNVFPSRLHKHCLFLSEREGDSLLKYKKCLTLLCDVEYRLLQWCSKLKEALSADDTEKWRSLFKKLKEKIYENPYSGSDYQLLNKYKQKLYGIEEYEFTPTFKASAKNVLNEVLRQLNKEPKNILRLSQLCPALSRCDDCPATMLGLRDNISVVRFDERVQVFTDSIRRPVLLKVLLSNGRTKKYLHKSGEPLEVDAAAQNVLRYAGELWEPLNCKIKGYSVIPLSEDSGLIEYLEDHVRIRDLIKESCDLEAILSDVTPRSEKELLSTPLRALVAEFEKSRVKVPKDALRQGIMKRCVSEQHKHMVFNMLEKTLASSSIITWILGLGDRHLQNILYNTVDGGVCHVDWGAACEFVREPPPARLPATSLHVCNITELEATLQQLLSALRRSCKLFSAVLKISFKWMDGFDGKLKHMSSVLEGRARSYDVSRLALQHSEKADFEKTKLIQVLDEVFVDFERKHSYDVEEQITCLLRHCTDPRILSITRAEWEPWL